MLCDVVFFCSHVKNGNVEHADTYLIENTWCSWDLAHDNITRISVHWGGSMWVLTMNFDDNKQKWGIANDAYSKQLWRYFIMLVVFKSIVAKSNFTWLTAMSLEMGKKGGVPH